MAIYPQSFHVNVIPTTPFLAIPKVSSERREYVPIGWLGPPTIPSDLLFVLQNATLSDFALITSRMHMSWLRNIGGRLESRYRYSIGIVYNPFPWPQLDLAAKQKLEKLAKSVLDARAAHKGATLADLYDPDVMPADLRKRIARSTRRSIGSIVRSLLLATAKGWSIFLACTKNSPRRCSPPPPNASAAGKK